MILKDLKWVEIIQEEIEATRNSALYIIPTDDSFRIFIIDDEGEKREFVSIESNDKNFIYEQTTPSLVWNIPHNLNKLVSVTLLDSFGNEFESHVIQTNTSLVEIHNDIPVSGKAILN